MYLQEKRGLNLTIWYDNCSGQNKSQVNVGFMSFLIEQGNFESVTYKYLESGHTFNACDTSAGVTERKVKVHTTIELPEDMYRILEGSRKEPSPFKVVRMKQENFLAWKQWGAWRFRVLKRCDQDGSPFYISNARQMAMLKACSRTLLSRYTFFAKEPWHAIDIDLNRNRPAPSAKNTQVKRLRNTLIPLPVTVAKDLRFLSKFLSRANQAFYQNLLAEGPHEEHVHIEPPEDDAYLAKFDRYGPLDYQVLMKKLGQTEEAELTEE